MGVFSLLSGLLESVDEDKEEKEGIDHKCDLNPWHHKYILVSVPGLAPI